MLILNLILIINSYENYDYLGGGYSKKGGIIFYKDREVGSDNNFQPLGFKYGKDNQYTYYKQDKFLADLSTFQVLEDFYAVDNNTGYFKGDKRDNLDPNIKFLGNFYAKVDNGLTYFRGKPFNTVDGFTIICEKYSKDNHNDYYKDIKLNENPNLTCFLKDNNYAKDDQKFYFKGNEIPQANQLEVLGYGYARDATNSYYNGEILDIYGNSIQIEPVDFGYAICPDYSKMFYNGIRVDGSYTGTVTSKNDFYSKDGLNPFYKENTFNIFEGLDTFESLGYGFAKSQSEVFLNGVIFGVEDVKASSFKAIGGLYSVDFDSCYYDNDPINPRACDNPITLKYLGDDYAYDSDHLYYKGEEISDNKPFHYDSDYNIVTDAYSGYYKGNKIGNNYH